MDLDSEEGNEIEDELLYRLRDAISEAMNKPEKTERIVLRFDGIYKSHFQSYYLALTEDAS